MPDLASRSKRAWREAQSFEELCELGRRFVAGELGYFPGWGASTLDVESDAIAIQLIALNQSGFLTVASQPGRRAGLERSGVRIMQRAFVCGFARPARARALVRAARSAELVALRQSTNADGGEPIAVTLQDGEPRVFTGHGARAAELDLFRASLHPRALAELDRCDYLSVHDPRWGRQRTLWRALNS